MFRFSFYYFLCPTSCKLYIKKNNKNNISDWNSLCFENNKTKHIQNIKWLNKNLKKKITIC